MFYFRKESDNEISPSHKIEKIQLETPSPPHIYDVVQKAQEDKDLQLRHNPAYSFVAKGLIENA